MKQWGGKGRIGLWLIAFTTKNSPQKTIGFMLDTGGWKDFGWLLSFGTVPGGTVGIGWVRKQQRVLDAQFAAKDAKHG